MKCSYHNFILSTLNVTMCLIPNDLLSNSIKRNGHWIDCDEIVRTSKSSQVFVDIGANIGACSIQALVQTSNKIYAIEPIEKHLFYLKESIRLLDTKFPFLNVSQRITVIPKPVGSRVYNVNFHSDPGNTGHTFVNEVSEKSNFTVDTLDHMLFKYIKNKKVTVKIDVEGFECHVFLGMVSILENVEHILFEMSDSWLAKQGCSKEILLGILKTNHFAIPKKMYQMHSHYGTNMLVHKIRNSN